MNLTNEILDAVNKSIQKAIEDTLSGYGSPLKKYIEQVVCDNADIIRGIVNAAMTEIRNDDTFRQTMIQGIRHKIAREITNSFGEGIFTKEIKKLKADPTVKARCVLAVENILSERV